jgi:hypothetical protein
MNRRYLLLGIACLAVLFGVAFCVWPTGLLLSWTIDLDRASYARVTRAIAADPQHLGGRRLYDVSRELGVENAPWDDGNLQNRPGSLRIYHFRGFALWVSLEYMREGLTDNMLLERGSAEEKLQSRDLLRIDPNQPPSIMIDGLSSREERMRLYFERAEESAREMNEQMELKRQRGPN